MRRCPSYLMKKYYLNLKLWIKGHWKVTTHGRKMQMKWKDLSLKTKWINTADGTVLEYQKIFRFTGSPDFDTDFFAWLHILRRLNDNVPGEEFVKILHRSVTWYMFVAPKGWQIFCLLSWLRWTWCFAWYSSRVCNMYTYHWTIGMGVRVYG